MPGQSNKKNYLFSYGTLQKEKVQMELFGRTLQGTKDKLRGFKIKVIEISDQAFLSKGEEKYQKTLMASFNKNDFIEGMAFELTEEELLKADAYEPANYKRVKKILDSGTEAWIYLASEEPGLNS